MRKKNVDMYCTTPDQIIASGGSDYIGHAAPPLLPPPVAVTASDDLRWGEEEGRRSEMWDWLIERGFIGQPPAGQLHLAQSKIGIGAVELPPLLMMTDPSVCFQCRLLLILF
jgi:hypothetical protein